MDRQQRNKRHKKIVHATVRQIKESVNGFCSICSIICWVSGPMHVARLYMNIQFIPAHTVSIYLVFGERKKKSEKINKICGCWNRRSMICFRYVAHIMYLIYPEPDAQQNNKIIHKININNSHHRSSFIIHNANALQKVRTVNNNWKKKKGWKMPKCLLSFWNRYMVSYESHSNEEGLQRIIVCVRVCISVLLFIHVLFIQVQ